MGTRTKKPKAGTIRPGAIRADVYNEGLCVYLHDEANTDRLRVMIADKKKFPQCSPKKTFFENLSTAKLSKEAKSAGLALAYTLDQDDEVSVDVVIGDPLNEKELAVAEWLDPQRARIALPSGRLRIDTPNTMPLDPDDKHDAGAVVDVPPGDYVLTLYRVDWDELRRSGKRYKGPSEALVLTPTDKAGEAKLEGPILEWKPRKRPRVGGVKPKSGQSEFNCKLIFLGYWENFGVNFTRESAAKMGLEPGARLRFTIEKIVLDALFLGEMTPADCMRYFPKPKLEAAVAPFKEFALTEWSSMPKKEFLAFRRVQAKKCIPERLIEKWFPATGIVLPERWDLPRPAAAPPVEIKGKAIRGTVLFSSPEEAVLDITAKHLEAIGAKPGDLLRLQTENGASRTLAYGAEISAQSMHTVFTRALAGLMEQAYGRMIELKYRYFTFDGPNAYAGMLPFTRLEKNDAWPVVAVQLPGVGDPARASLRLTPFLAAGESGPTERITGLGAGTRVEVRSI